MDDVLYLIIGLIAGAALLIYARSYSARAEKQILANALIIAAIIYVIFAFIWGNATWWLIEIIGVPIYGAFAWASLRYSPNWLAVGWLLHPIWDVSLHLLGPGNMIAPHWYATACITFDILIAGYVFYRAKYWHQNLKKV